MVLLLKVTNITVIYGRINMSRVKCVECGKLAHLVSEGKAYCAECAPKPTMPVTVEETLVNELIIEKIENPEKVERPKEWSDPPDSNKYFKTLQQCTEPKKPWWKRLFSF